MLQQRRRVSFFEPARLSTPPKPLFSQKPLDARSSMNAFGVVAPFIQCVFVEHMHNTHNDRG